MRLVRYRTGFELLGRNTYPTTRLKYWDLSMMRLLKLHTLKLGFHEMMTFKAN